MMMNDLKRRAFARGAWLLAAAAVLAGCASGPTADANDPFQPYNRGMNEVNRGADRAVLKPVASAYRAVVPGPVRAGVSNFFANLGDAWSAANSVLQFKVRQAGEDAGRFAMNTVFGIGGLFDIASRAGIDRHNEDFGTTLGHWGVPSGPYLVLPLFGPSTVRDALALPIDLLASPVRLVHPPVDRNALVATDAVDTRARLLPLDPVVEGSVDRYLFLRDAYLQRRQAQIAGRNDAPSPDPEDASPTKPEPKGEP